MPRFMKGAKWVFGWVIVGKDRSIAIPPEAWDRYDFRVGDEAIFLQGSKKSGGFALGTPRLLRDSPLIENEARILGRGRFREDGDVLLPVEIEIHPGDRLLTVFGSGLALGFITRGPIYAEAQNHPELEIFGV